MASNLKELPVALPITPSPKITKHKQNIQTRNNIITVKYHTGTTIVELAKEYKLSKKQIGRIITASEKIAKIWMSQAPEATSVILNEMIVRESYENMQALKSLIHSAEKQHELETAAHIRIQYAGVLDKFRNIVTNGATLYQARKMVKEAERVINTGRAL